MYDQMLQTEAGPTALSGHRRSNDHHYDYGQIYDEVRCECSEY